MRKILSYLLAVGAVLALAEEVKGLENVVKKEVLAQTQTQVDNGEKAKSEVKEERYVVQKGDSLWKICRNYEGVSAEDIAYANNIEDAKKIKPGQELVIPIKEKKEKVKVAENQFQEARPQEKEEKKEAEKKDGEKGEEAKTLVLERTEYTDKYVMGRLYFGKQFLGHTLEPPWKDNQRRVSCIPEGTYRIKWREIGRFAGKSYEIEDVPDRDDVLIHSGNKIGETEGCPMLGLKRGEGYIVGGTSRPAIKGMQNALGRNNYTLIVKREEKR